MATEGEQDEDDYLSMTFTDAPAKESSLQRAARMRKTASDRNRVLTKAEKAAKERATIEASFEKEIDSSNKGAQMLAKMGFKGGALGKSEDGRTRPIGIALKSDRGGIGLDAEKKRKFEEATRGLEKRQKATEAEYIERNRTEQEEKYAERQMWSAMKTLESFETDVDADKASTQQAANENRAKIPDTTRSKRVPLRSINVLYRPLVKQRLEEEQKQTAQKAFTDRLSRPKDSDNPDSDNELPARDTELAEDPNDSDSELDEFEALTFVDRLGKIVSHLRKQYCYCFWCKYRYPDESMDGCPGTAEDEHG